RMRQIFKRIGRAWQPGLLRLDAQIMQLHLAESLRLQGHVQLKKAGAVPWYGEILIKIARHRHRLETSFRQGFSIAPQHRKAEGWDSTIAHNGKTKPRLTGIERMIEHQAHAAMLRIEQSLRATDMLVIAARGTT